MSDTPRDRWQRGDCPCCGGSLDWWPDTDPEPVAEGVILCGRCVENEHHLRPPGFLGTMLAALLTGEEVA